jgi:hypothetical protein
MGHNKNLKTKMRLIEKKYLLFTEYNVQYEKEIIKVDYIQAVCRTACIEKKGSIFVNKII